MCVTTACQCLHVFSCLSITTTPSSFLDMAKPKCLHTLDPKVEHQQFHKLCHSGLPHHLQHPPLLLYCQICISEPRADGNCSPHFALLCFTVAENSFCTEDLSFDTCPHRHHGHASRTDHYIAVQSSICAKFFQLAHAVSCSVQFVSITSQM